MSKSDLTIRKINNTNFLNYYKKFILGGGITEKSYICMLSIATVFLNSTNENVKRLGYRMIVTYCNQSGNYKPLYEIAVNLGLIPISKFIEKKYKFRDNIFTEFNAAIGESFFIDNVYCSFQQRELINFYELNDKKTLTVVAPTSYGKTDLILSTVKNCRNKNICVITPTKSLLAQTKLRIIQSKVDWVDKIITHPEMYNGKEKNLIAIMTQERLLRLLKKEDNLNFDYVVIDEAHVLMHDDDRNRLLASAILILEKRNQNTIFKFLTPFLCDPDNMKVRYSDYIVKSYKVNEYIKTEKIYLVDLKNRQRKGWLYDQFLNEFFEVEMSAKIENEWSFIENNASEKNIVYLNKPKDIENIVRKICSKRKKYITDEIDEACKNIAEYVHPKYKMIECLKHGGVYHHGSVPEPVRMYVERLYSAISSIKYIITSSTLLEGVNIPGDKMFILDNKKGRNNLSAADLKNLIGRVCRFSQIFDLKKGSLKKLEPHIYFVEGEYYSENANVKKFIQSRLNVEKKISDSLENVLLKNKKITNDNKEALNKVEEFIENYEEGIIEDYSLRKTKTEVGKACFINNITEFDIFSEEEKIQDGIASYKLEREVITNTEELFDLLYKLFFSKIIDDNNIKRFEHEEARKFYKMFIDWRIENASLNYMIRAFLKYWNGIKLKVNEQDNQEANEAKYVFVGPRWGDEKRNGMLALWTDISQKEEFDLINLAIVRIKEEQDFLDNKLIKYIEVLHDIELLDENLYLNIKYGTSNKKIIVCVKNGMSLSLAKLLVEKYIRYISIDINNDMIKFKEGLISRMQDQAENEIMIQELRYYV